MAKITEYPAATSFDSGDILIKDGTNGTKKISVDDASVNFIKIANQTVDSSLIPTINDCVLITNDTDGVRKMLVSDISGNAHSRELTYSQYQALSNAEKTNGTTYYVTDDPNDSSSGGGGGSSENYSYTEQAVGTWVDGSTIYKKTIDFGALPDSTTKTVEAGLTNVGIVIKIEGICYLPSYFATLDSNNSPSSVGWIFAYLKSTDEIRCLTGYNRSDYRAYVTIYYTKSTS